MSWLNRAFSPRAGEVEVLYHPFSDFKESWNTVSIIDPVFTFPLSIGILVVIVLKNRRHGRISILWAVLYFSLGLFKENVEYYTTQLAESRVLRIEGLSRPSHLN